MELPIERFPLEILADVFESLPKVEKTLCSMVSTHWLALSKTLWPDLRTNPNKLMCYSAESGHKRQLILAKRQGATYFTTALSLAAQGGHIDCMKLVKGWGETRFNWGLFGATELTTALMIARQNDCINYLHPVKGWGKAGLNWALFGAIEGGHIDCANLARKWGATELCETEIGIILIGAANSEHMEYMHLAKKWMDKRWVKPAKIKYRLLQKKELINYAFIDSATHGSMHCMKLLKKWGANDFNRALITAATHGSMHCMKLLKKWGANNFNEVLIASAYESCIKCMKLAKKWGATDFNGAMVSAAKGGETECMELAKKWGASNFNKALYSAAEGKQLESMELAKEWSDAAHSECPDFYFAKKMAYRSEEGDPSDDSCELTCDNWIDEKLYKEISDLRKELKQAKKEINCLSKKLEQAEKEIEIKQTSGFRKKLKQAKKEINCFSKKLEQAEKEIEIMRTSDNTHSTSLFPSCQEPVPATPPPITRLPPEMIVESFNWLTGEEKVLCMMTCRNWHDLIKRYTPELAVSSNDLLVHAAKNGYRNLLKLAKQRGATDFDGAMYIAATGGNIDLMKLLRDWIITHFMDQITVITHKNNIIARCKKLLEGRYTLTDFNYILYGAAKGGNIDCMKLAKKWGATHFDFALHGAAEKGQIECLKLLKKWGATKFNSPLRDAAIGGSLESLKLLKNWGATEFSWALSGASEFGQVECMKLLKNWGVNDFGEAFANAIYGGQIECMQLLKKWGVLRTINIDNMLCRAAKHWHIKCLKLLKKWGAADFNRALVATVIGECDDRPSHDSNLPLDENEAQSQIEFMKLLKEWGATNFNEALEAKFEHRDSEEMTSWHKFNPEAVKILKGWIAVTCKPSNF